MDDWQTTPVFRLQRLSQTFVYFCIVMSIGSKVGSLFPVTLLLNSADAVGYRDIRWPECHKISISNRKTYLWRL